MIWGNTIKLNNTTISVLRSDKEYWAKVVSIQHQHFVILETHSLKCLISKIH